MTWTRPLKLLLFMTCREAAPRISRGMDRMLPPLDRTAVRLHLSICPCCRRYRRQLTLLGRVAVLLRHRPPSRLVEPLPQQARERIRLALGRMDQ
jgi:hypothetical protein